MTHERLRSMFSDRDRSSARKRAAVARADHVICVSEATRRDLVELFGVPAAKLSVVHHGYSAAPAKLASGSQAIGRPYVLFVGNRTGYKNFARLVEAFATSPRLRSAFSLVCAGGGPFTPAERDHFRRHGLAPEHTVFRECSDLELWELYSGASVFVYPSLYEGFGMPLLEAMAAGCPVACSKIEPFVEVADDAAEYFDPHRVEGIQHGLQRVLGSPSFAAALVCRGAKRVTGFSWEKCAEETRAIYARLL
jgi:glycosyltransferase involved in cell wall biosynthesis